MHEAIPDYKDRALAFGFRGRCTIDLLSTQSSSFIPYQLISKIVPGRVRESILHNNPKNFLDHFLSPNSLSRPAVRHMAVATDRDISERDEFRRLLNTGYEHRLAAAYALISRYFCWKHDTESTLTCHFPFPGKTSRLLRGLLRSWKPRHTDGPWKLLRELHVWVSGQECRGTLI